MAENSFLAYILYTTIVLGGIKLLGANLTWVMVFFPVWGLGIGLILFVITIIVIIGALK